MSSHSFGEAMYPEGFRKIVAMLILFASTSLPAVHAWQYGDEEAAAQARAPRAPIGFRGVGMGGMGGGFAPGVPTPKPESGGTSWSTWLAMIGGAGGLMLYYPRWGFKRYGLLCGPCLGLGSMMLTTVWLEGREQVYRAELAFAAILGAMPGLLMYLTLAWIKFRRLARREVPIVVAEFVPEVIDAEAID